MERKTTTTAAAAAIKHEHRIEYSLLDVSMDIDDTDTGATM